MSYSDAQMLMALTLCRETRNNLAKWADAFACEEPDAAATAFELIEKVDRLLDRMNTELE